MCLIAFCWNPGQETPLVVAANRDEFYARPAAAAKWWPANNGQDTILAGQDLQAGGTWLGVDSYGRFAALTNYRDPKRMRKQVRSRGELVSGFLLDPQKPLAEKWLQKTSARSGQYNDFNLLLYDGLSLLAFESRNSKVFEPPTGLHALSNADFDTPWPKVRKMYDKILGSIDDQEAVFEILADTALAPENELPQTGIPLQREKALSAVFIQTEDYGTRASTIVRIGQQQVDFCERRFAPNVTPQQSSFHFDRALQTACADASHLQK